MRICGRFVSATDAEGLVRLFVVDERQVDAVEPSYNVAPTDPVPAIVEHGDRRHLVRFRWGLVPHWAPSLGVGTRMINARSETAADKPAFSDSLARRRCLIPADGFYEWQRRDDQKLPWFISAPDGNPVAFAGVWAVWRDAKHPETAPIRTCSILTTAARGAVAHLHDRMPLTRSRNDWDRWLDRSATDAGLVEDVLHGTGESKWHTRRVPTLVNSVANDGPELLSHVEQ